MKFPTKKKIPLFHERLWAKDEWYREQKFGKYKDGCYERTHVRINAGKLSRLMTSLYFFVEPANFSSNEVGERMKTLKLHFVPSAGMFNKLDNQT